MLGRLLSIPVKLLNVGPRALEKLVDGMTGLDTPEHDRILSKPLKALSDAIEEIDDEK